MKCKINASLLFFVVCLGFLSLVRVASAENAGPEQKEKAALYIVSTTDISNVQDAELASVYREADASLLDQIKDKFMSRGMKVNVVASEKDIAAGPGQYILLVSLDKIELGGKRPFGRTAKVKAVYALQNKDRFQLIKRSHEETSAQKWQNCIKKISEQLVADVTNDIARLSVPHKPEEKLDKPKQAPTGSSSEDRLREIENLKAKGLITEKEYEAKRKEILDEL